MKDSPITDIVVDADSMIYIAGFATEKQVYETEDGELFNTLTEAKLHCAVQKIEENTIVSHALPQPAHYAMRLVKNMFTRVLNKVNNNNPVGYSVTKKDLRVLLTGDACFREFLATSAPYKGNRISRRPVHFDEIRKYIVNNYDGVICHGIEADDATAMLTDSLRADGRSVAIAGIDKDLDQISGLHVNYKTGDSYVTSPKDAVYHFYHQLLTGDSSDNIPGIPGVGKVTATTILSGGFSHLPLEKYSEECFWHTLCAYEKRADRIAEQWGKKPYEYLLEQGRLVYLLRGAPAPHSKSMGKPWEPPF